MDATSRRRRGRQVRQEHQRNDLGPDNWLKGCNIERSFKSVDSFLPTASISPGDAVRDVPLAATALNLDPVRVSIGSSPTTMTVGNVLAATHTEAFLVHHRGRIMAQRFSPNIDSTAPWLMMSCTKSLIGLVCGALTEQGLLDVNRTVAHYVRELADSGYAEVPIRHVLDMRSSVDFIEDYSNPNSGARRMEQELGWRPPTTPPRGGHHFLRSIQSVGAPGGSFTYRLADTDVLGWVAERVAGKQIHDLIQEVIWHPAGAASAATLILDPVGDGVHDGGFSASAQDMGRVGLHLLDAIAGEVDAYVPASWLIDALHPPIDVIDAFATSKYAAMLPGGWYRNQMWGWAAPSAALVFLGIHGQAVFLDPPTHVVIVNQSSWPTPSDEVRLRATLAAFRSVSDDLRDCY